MLPIHQIGKLMITLGTILVVSGLLIYFGDFLHLGRLPGDILYKNGKITIFFPWVTVLLVSLVVGLVLRLLPFRG